MRTRGILIWTFLYLTSSTSGQVLPLSLDESFNSIFWGITDFQSSVSAIYCTEEGNILIGGDFSGEWDNPYDDCLVLLNTNGAIENQFQKTTVILYGSGVYDIKKKDSTFYCLGGGGQFYKFLINGEFDLPFMDTLGAGICIMYMGSFVLTSNEKILITGLFSENLLPFPFDSCSNFDFPFGQINTDGSLDSTFYPALGFSFDNDVNVVKTNDEKILCYGGFSSFNGIYSPRICRLNIDGSFDSTFHSIFSNEFVDTSNSQSYIISTLFLDNNGRIIVGGHMLLEGDTSVYHLLRLENNGSLDSTFNFQNNVEILDNTGGIYGSISCGIQMEDGGYLIGGFFDKYQDTYRNNLVKTDSNGFIELNYFNGPGVDTAYFEVWTNPYATPFPASISTLAEDSLGRVYVGGHFHKYDNVVRNSVFRLHGLHVGMESELATPTKLLLYPNPADDEFQLVLSNSTSSSATYELIITNLTGNVTMKSEIQLNHHISFPAKNIASGIYFVSLLKADEIISVSKLVVQH